jgi:hypothetical protein
VHASINEHAQGKWPKSGPSNKALSGLLYVQHIVPTVCHIGVVRHRHTHHNNGILATTASHNNRRHKYVAVVETSLKQHANLLKPKKHMKPTSNRQTSLLTSNMTYKFKNMQTYTRKSKPHKCAQTPAHSNTPSRLRRRVLTIRFSSELFCPTSDASSADPVSSRESALIFTTPHLQQVGDQATSSMTVLRAFLASPGHELNVLQEPAVS